MEVKRRREAGRASERVGQEMMARRKGKFDIENRRNGLLHGETLVPKSLETEMFLVTVSNFFPLEFFFRTFLKQLPF